MGQKLGISVETALNSKKTFYEKRCQGNGFYPVYKYTWDEKEQQYRMWNSKSGNVWISWGFQRNDYLEYKFEHNSCILSFEEMKDKQHFNDK